MPESTIYPSFRNYSYVSCPIHFFVISFNYLSMKCVFPNVTSVIFESIALKKMIDDLTIYGDLRLWLLKSRWNGTSSKFHIYDAVPKKWSLYSCKTEFNKVLNSTKLRRVSIFFSKDRSEIERWIWIYFFMNNFQYGPQTEGTLQHLFLIIPYNKHWFSVHIVRIN